MHSNTPGVPQVTIVIPVYNYEQFLTETLDNLKNQEFENWEAIIVNDGSVDRSEELALKFVNLDQRFKYIRQNNSGLSAARNTGIRAAKGKYIQLLDADDLLSTKKISLHFYFMEGRPDINISYTDAVYFKSDNPLVHYKCFDISEKGNPILSNKVRIPNLDGSCIPILEYLLIQNIAPVNSFLIRKEVFDLTGFFNSSYKSLEDWEFWFRAAIGGSKFARFSDAGAYAKVRVHSSSMSFNRHIMDIHLIRLQREMILALKKLDTVEASGLITKNLPLIDKHFRRMIRNAGIFNVGKLANFASETSKLRFIRLYIRELFRAIVF